MWLLLIANLVLAAMVVKFALDIVLAVWCNAIYGIPYVPSNSKLTRETIKLLNLKKGQKVIELGSGDGRVLIEFARKYQIIGIGYEKNRLLLWMANIKWALTWPKKGKVNFENRDLFEVTVKGADMVYMYLLPWMVEKLRGRLEMELKKGARVISIDYPMKSKIFESVEIVRSGRHSAVIYKKLVG